MISKLSKFLIVLTLALASVSESRAQEVVWDASFDFFFDNREYKSEINWPQTLFGARIAPELGVQWSKEHTLMIGADLLADFGRDPFDKGNEFLAYYQYSNKKLSLALGIIPRRKLIGDYPTAFMSDSVRYYDPNISGLLLQYMGDKGYVEFGCDWNSQISNEKREKFLLFSAGRLYKNIGLTSLYAGYHFTMYHHAGTFLEDGVVDNVLVQPHIGVDFSKSTVFDQLSFQVGWIQSFQNDRKYVGSYVSPGGVQVEFKIEKKKFGLFNTFYAGDNLMPYYATNIEGLDYGPGLYWGEPFYRTSNIYNRAEIYWQPINNSKMNLRVSSVHHYDGKIWNWQQKVCFTLRIGRNQLFRNNPLKKL